VSGPTYADFVAAMTTKAVDGSRTWSGNMANPGDSSRKRFITTMATASGSMNGTTWNNGEGVSTSSIVARAVQHAFPDSTTFNAGVAAGHLVYIEVLTTEVAEVYGVTRNGYTSNTAGDGETSFLTKLIARLIRWDATAGVAKESVPYIGGAETTYTLGSV
jgi:hypothetical protein